MSDFASRLVTWHQSNGRHDLPWQNTRDPYRIWLSEIMLQQTQVETVIPYYARFLDRFPDLATLAAASVDDVLGLWSGLGYYARGRNLHKAAQAIATLHHGRFPVDADTIATLPGIGRSTAAAIAAFAFGQRRAILDGNVKRVLCRVFGVEGFPGTSAVETRLWALAESLLPQPDDESSDAVIATYIQAQMDLGATLCTRTRPACERCPFAADCVALQTGRVGVLPTPRPKKAIPKRHTRVALIIAENCVLLERRPPTGIWGGLLVLPEMPDSLADSAPGSEPDHAWLQRSFGLASATVTRLAPVKHAFTHFHLEIAPVRFDVEHAAPILGEAIQVWLSLDSLAGAGLPAPVQRILEAVARRDLFSAG